MKLNFIDSLTGLFNTTYFNKKLEDEYQHALRYNTPLSLSLLDIDQLGEFHDRLGRKAAEAYMKGLASLIASCIRKVDIAARHRDKEIAIIMPHTTGESASIQSERLRDMASTLEVTFENHTILSTVSIGVASLNFDAGMATKGLITAAGKALDTAKEEGKNRIVLNRT